MMRCPDAEKLQRFADGELKESDRSRIAEHIQSCERCAKIIERLQRVGVLVAGAIRRETEKHDLSGLWEGVRDGIASPAPQPGVWKRLRALLWKPALRVAYAAAVVLVAGALAVKVFVTGPEHPPAMAAQATVDRVFSYDPEVTVSVVMSSSDDAAVVWITGLEATKEN